MRGDTDLQVIVDIDFCLRGDIDFRVTPDIDFWVKIDIDFKVTVVINFRKTEGVNFRAMRDGEYSFTGRTIFGWICFGASSGVHWWVTDRVDFWLMGGIRFRVM